MPSRRPPLFGDIIGRALAAAKPNAASLAGPELPPRERSGALDAQSIAELLAYDIPFDIEPAIAFSFPAEVDRA